MNQPQIIHTETGDLVVIPREQYDALVAAAAGDEDAEDAADVAAFDAAMAQLAAEGAAGLDTTLPVKVGAAMLRGASRLTAWRKFRGLSQHMLAQQAEVGQGYLSQIERGEREGSPETLKRIADSMGLRIDQIR